MKYAVASLAVSGLFLSFNSVAAESVEEIVVTATRTAQTADETLASVSVITREDIERSQAQSVTDLLRGEPGVSIYNNGGAGKTTSIFLRGAESDHVLVLIDGVKVGSATAGTTAFENIPLSQIERIEIVRGPRSSLYGSEAIGGVIQIFTRKGGGPLSLYFSVTGGSYRTFEATTGVSGGGQNGWFNINASDYSSDGFNACNGTLTAGCFTIEPDKDGYRSKSGSVRTGYRFGDRAEADVHWLRADGQSNFDGSSQNQTQTVQEVYGGRVRVAPFTPWQITLSAGRGFDFSDNFLNSVFASRFDTRRDTASLQNDFSLGIDQIFTLGIDYQNDRVDSTTLYTVNSRDNQGVFTQYQGNYGAQNIQLAYRRDNNEQFGHHDTGNLAWGYRLSEELRFFAAYGTAFKAPTFNELYFPGYSNPGLQPTTSRTAEVGARGGVAGTRWSLAFYESTVDNLIVYDSTTGAAVNADPLLRGCEATLVTPLVGWETRTALTLLHPENRSGDAFDGNDLPRRARESFRLDADRGVGPFRLGTTLRGEGRRYDDLANTVELKSYATLDLRGDYPVSRDWRLQARIENLLDKTYETAAYYNQPGRSFYLTLRYQLQRN